MKVLNSSPITAFGGVNFVIKETINLKIRELLNNNLPQLAKQSKYDWFDILMSYWAVFFCGGDCAEDLSCNLRKGLEGNPFIKIPSPDQVLNRISSLSVPAEFFTAKRGKKKHQFSITEELNCLNLKMLSLLPGFSKKDIVLDYDNTIIFNKKADSERTYKKEYGYNPGVGLIDKHVVYVENRNGSSNAHILQHDTINRMCSLLKGAGISIDAIRADSASYTYEIIQSMEQNSKRLFIKARMTSRLENAISNIKEWKEIQVGNQILHRGSTSFTPFIHYAKENKMDKGSLKSYRLVVTKEARRDGQANLFTGEAYNYSAILTNDFKMTDDEVVFFYNARGAREREFDILKNDFGWDKMPFSRLEQNSVFLVIMAMCKNLYTHMIEKFSVMTKFLSPHFRIKKFIFRFICIPAKWIRSGRTMKLKLYGSLAFKT